MILWIYNLFFLKKDILEFREQKRKNHAGNIFIPLGYELEFLTFIYSTMLF